MSLLNDIQVLYEDDSVVAINKPAGLVVHYDGRTEEPNVCDWLLKHYPDAKGVGEAVERDGKPDIERPGIVHRLDRDTSGVMLLAKTQPAYEHLKSQFKEREIHKEYRTFLYGQLDESRGVIDEPIGRSSQDFRRYTTGGEIRGKARRAVTEYQVLYADEKVSYVSASPKTGRTHQIRVHFTHRGHPVVADPLYAAGYHPLLGFERQALHAHAISFETLAGNEEVVTAPLTADFQEAARELGINE